MAKGDNITGLYYGRRSDGVDLYRFAVPNVRVTPKPMGEAISANEESFWTAPQFEITQDQTGNSYSSAIDVANRGYTYTETDIPVESEATDDTTVKTQAYDIIVGGEAE